MNNCSYIGLYTYQIYCGTTNCDERYILYIKYDHSIQHDELRRYGINK